MLTTGLEYVDRQLVGVTQGINKAKESDEGSRTKELQEVHLSSLSSPKLYSNVSVQLFQRKKDEASEKASQAKSSRSSQFMVVSSVLLLEQAHPARWINRQ